MLIPIQDAAKKLGIHRVTLHRYIRDGKLSAWKKSFDHRTYVEESQLDKLKEAQLIR